MQQQASLEISDLPASGQIHIRGVAHRVLHARIGEEGYLLLVLQPHNSVCAITMALSPSATSGVVVDYPAPPSWIAPGNTVLVERRPYRILSVERPGRLSPWMIEFEGADQPMPYEANSMIERYRDERKTPRLQIVPIEVAGDDPLAFEPDTGC